MLMVKRRGDEGDPGGFAAVYLIDPEVVLPAGLKEP